MSKLPPKKRSIKLPFPATLESVDKATIKVKNFLNSAGIREHSKYFDIVLGLREALNNAVMHGSRKDINKTISLSLRLEDENLVMEIEDGGDGFNWKPYMEKTLPSIEESGRGLAIMKSCFTSIKYNEKGNRLIIIQKI